MFRGTVVVLAAFALLSPAVAAAAPDELSTTDRLDDTPLRRRRARAPTRSAPRTAATRRRGFHTRGEMGGFWTPPIKLLDGLWFGVDGPWLAGRREFTSGCGLRADDACRRRPA